MPPPGITSRASCAISRRAGVDKPEATRATVEGAARPAHAGDGRVRAQHPRGVAHGDRRSSPPISTGCRPTSSPATRRMPSGAVTLTTSAGRCAAGADVREERGPAPADAGGDLQRRRARERRRARSHPARARRASPGLLGYRNWAAYDTQVRMAGDEKAVSAFIDRVVAAARPRATRELAELTRRKQQDRPGEHAESVGPPAITRSWSGGRATTSTPRLVRPYFAFDRVLDGVLRVTGTIFGAHLSAGRGRPGVASVGSRLRDAGRQHAGGAALSRSASARRTRPRAARRRSRFGRDAKARRSRRSCWRRACPGISRTIPG